VPIILDEVLAEIPKRRLIVPMTDMARLAARGQMALPGEARMTRRFVSKLLAVAFFFALGAKDSLGRPKPMPDTTTVTPPAQIVPANLPNVADPVATVLRESPTEPASSQARLHPSDRDYYQFLVDAGGFAEDQPRYVCFSDDSRSGGFFTFSAYAYDADYDHAEGELLALQSNAGSGLNPVTPAEKDQLDIMSARQSDAPYVNLLMKGLLESLSPEVQERLRSGGRVLEMTDYEKGVRGGTIEFLWDGDSWSLELVPKNPHAGMGSKTFSLNIEPATMRYALSGTVTKTGARGESAATHTRQYGGESGACERVADPR
jgi:hypothetical protein